jgi:hypothetical protein
MNIPGFTAVVVFDRAAVSYMGGHQTLVPRTDLRQKSVIPATICVQSGGLICPGDGVGYLRYVCWGGWGGLPHIHYQAVASC